MCNECIALYTPNRDYSSFNTLSELLGDVCNKSTDIDHFMNQTMDTLYIVLQLSGNKMSLAEYYKIFNAKRKSATNAGHEFYTAYMVAFVNLNGKQRYGWDDANVEYQAWKYMKTSTRKNVSTQECSCKWQEGTQE